MDDADERISEEVKALLSHFVDPATEDVIPSHPSEPLTGERLLLFCVLEEAKTTLVDPNAGRYRTVQDWEDAYDWLMSDEEGSFLSPPLRFTMRFICDRLGVSPQYTRQKILQQVPDCVWRRMRRIPPNFKSHVKKDTRHYAKSVRI